MKVTVTIVAAREDESGKWADTIQIVKSDRVSREAYGSKIIEGRLTTIETAQKKQE